MRPRGKRLGWIKPLLSMRTRTLTQIFCTLPHASRRTLHVAFSRGLAALSVGLLFARVLLRDGVRFALCGDAKLAQGSPTSPPAPDRARGGRMRHNASVTSRCASHMFHVQSSGSHTNSRCPWHHARHRLHARDIDAGRRAHEHLGRCLSARRTHASPSHSTSHCHWSEWGAWCRLRCAWWLAPVARLIVIR